MKENYGLRSAPCDHTEPRHLRTRKTSAKGKNCQKNLQKNRESQAKSFSKWQQLRQITRKNRIIFQFSILPLSWNMVEASFCKKVKQVAISVHWLTRTWNTIFPISQDSGRVCIISHYSRVRLCNCMGCSPPGTSVHGDAPGKKTGVGCHAFLQGIFPTQGLNPCL